jgi:hypothetical protein
VSFRSMKAAATTSLMLAAFCLTACLDGFVGSGTHHGADAGTEAPADGSPTQGHADGPTWANEQHDGGPQTQPPALTPNSVTVNVGINRTLVADYPGDACGSITRFLVLDVQGPGGALQHVDLDCQVGGQNGWTYYNLPAGHYTATMQLFDEDAGGKRVAATPVRAASGELTSGQGALIWVDFTYQDFAADYQGNLKWQVAWVNANGAAHGCNDATPPVAWQVVTVRDDQQRIVSARTVSPAGGSLTTDGNTGGPCCDYGASDAEVLPNLTWGVYTVKIEGYTADVKAAYCVQRPLFASKGESIIFPMLATPGGC